MPLATGLSPNLRLLDDNQPRIPQTGAPEIEIIEGGKMPQASGDALQIEHDDGSITISLDGKPINPGADKPRGGWFDNLVDDIDDMELGRISEMLMRGVSDDIESRKDWIEDRAQGIKLLGLKIEIPGQQGASDGAPIEGMSKVRHPLLLEACLRFQANARSELLPTDGPVKIRDDGSNATLAQDELAQALERDLNHFLTVTDQSYYPDTDKMLLMLGFGGTAFKKVYFCPLRNRPVSETVDADDLIVNNAATDLSNAKRITHRSMMRNSTVKRLQILGVYRDTELSIAKMPNLDSVQLEKNAQQGISNESNNPEDRDREIYEIYCELDLKGFEHKYKGHESGLEIPYRVTIDVSSRKILSIVRNYDEDDQELPEARINFVKYTFVPGMGFYDIGLLHILGNTTNALTAAWREMLDAGMYANFPGFLMADNGARQNTNIFRVPPGGGALIKTNGMKLNEAIMPLPYKDVGGGLMTLTENMAETGMRIGGTSEQQVGEGRADAPVGTTLAMIDQATKVMNAVHKRMHAAQAEEFRLLVRTFKENPESFWQRNRKPAYKWDEDTFLKAIEDYELTPQADPNTASHSQRVMKITGLKQLQAASPDIYDGKAIDTAALQTMGWNNPDQFFKQGGAEDMMKNPMVMKEIAELAIKKQDSESRAKTAQASATAASAKAMQDSTDSQLKQQQVAADVKRTQAETMRIMAEAQQLQAGGQADPTKVMDLQVQQAEIAQRGRDSELDAMNRMRDRESRERLEAVKMGLELSQNPQEIQTFNQIVKPDMIQRLEANEEPLLGDSGKGIK